MTRLLMIAAAGIAAVGCAAVCAKLSRDRKRRRENGGYCEGAVNPQQEQQDQESGEETGCQQPEDLPEEDEPFKTQPGTAHPQEETDPLEHGEEQTQDTPSQTQQQD